MKILIDLGAHDGTATRKMWPDYDRVYLWEPNPALWHNYLDPLHCLHIVRAAAWNTFGRVEFYIGQDGTMQGSSILGDKVTGSLPKDHILVRCYRFATWLQDSVTPSDHVTVKMNVEGAEYGILKDMMATNTLRLVDRLLIAWHHEKIPSISQNEHDYAVHMVEGEIPLVELWKG